VTPGAQCSRPQAKSKVCVNLLDLRELFDATVPETTNPA
jgi:hypothetical protein